MSPFLPNRGQGMDEVWEIVGETARARKVGDVVMKRGVAETSMSDSWRVLPK